MENYGQNDLKPISVGQWVLTVLLTFIPIVNIIMLIVWACGGPNTNPNKANWAKAMLIWMVISIVAWILLASTLMGALIAVANLIL